VGRSVGISSSGAYGAEMEAGGGDGGGRRRWRREEEMEAGGRSEGCKRRCKRSLVRALPAKVWSRMCEGVARGQVTRGWAGTHGRNSRAVSLASRFEGGWAGGENSLLT
jgi:hypothetical protein